MHFLLSVTHKLHSLLRLVIELIGTMIFYLALGHLGRFWLWLSSAGRYKTLPSDAFRDSIQFCDFVGLIFFLAIFMALTGW